MLQRYQIREFGQLIKRIRLFQDASLHFAIFVSSNPYCACLIPTFGVVYTEMQQWSEAKLVGTYNSDTNPEAIVADVREAAEWVLAEQTDRVHYHRHPDGTAHPYSCLRRET